VAQMGKNNLSSVAVTASQDPQHNYFLTDYMLGTIEYHLLFINTFYLHKQDASRKISAFLLNSQNNDTTDLNTKLNVQSAENCKEFSETVRQLPDIEDYKF
jgi:hypothetical protein